MTVPINPIFTSIDFDHRPRSYFFPMSAAKYLLATIKGTQRRREIEQLIESGNEREIQDWMAHSLNKTPSFAQERTPLLH